MSEALTIQESKRLVELEEIIERGLGDFMAVAESLVKIRDAKLYRIEHETWEDYLRKRWKFSKSYACRLIQAKEFSDAQPEGEKPKTEREARAKSKAKKVAHGQPFEEPEGETIDMPSEAVPAEDDDPPRVRTADEAFKAAMGGVDTESLFRDRVAEIRRAVESATMFSREQLITLANEYADAADKLAAMASLVWKGSTSEDNFAPQRIRGPGATHGARCREVLSYHEADSPNHCVRQF